MKKIILITILGALSLGMTPDFNHVADAIKIAENGHNRHPRFPYGIKSVKCQGEAACRRVCLNTLRKTYLRWLKSGGSRSYLEFLANRYAPLSDHKLNRFWLSNVRSLYGHD